MAYKKYIEKNGKIYGPYVYHSKRVGGKVVSEYRGRKKEEKKFRKKLVIGLAAILLLFAIFWVIFFKTQFSGRVVLDIEQQYNEGELLEGKINIKLKEGELLPYNSKLIIENANKQYEFNLSEIIKNETSSGTYFLENLEITGEGKGYGKIGKKEIIPTVFFKLNITSQEETTAEINETPIQNETTEEQINNKTENMSEIISEEPTEIITEVPTTETQIETIEEESIQDTTNQEEITEKITNETQPTITGNVISNTVSSISTFFKTILTGQIIQEEIQGDVSKNNPKEYNIPENSNVEIISGSVQTEEKELEKNILNIQIENGKAIISTNYSEIEQGFGKEYLGKEIILPVDLNELNLSLKEGEIVVKINYNNQEIYSLKDQIFSKEIIENFTEETNITEPMENMNETNITENLTQKNITYNLAFEKINLTENEKEIIKNNVEFPLIQTEVSEYKDKYYVLFTIDEYTMEHYYNLNLNETELKKQIDRDRIIWLKDLVNKFSENITQIERRTELDENYVIM
jgi:hypothetical protein